jgi:mono/diheme cytochrome c family protein
VIVALALAGCDEGDAGPFLGDPDYERDPALDVELISGRGGATSHNVGQNCMQCHQANGPGPGLFTVAGTLYDVDGAPHPDGVVELRTAPMGSGELVLRVEADANGNFYSTEALPLPDMPLFPWVLSDDGARTSFMPFPTRSAACNVCHAGGAVVRLPEA